MCRGFSVHLIFITVEYCRLNPGVEKYLREMDAGGRAHLRKAARVRDESRQDKAFRVVLSQADADKAEANRKADQVKEQNAAEKRRILEAFKPTLSLTELVKKTIDGFGAPAIREQLKWHRDIGGNPNLKGLSHMTKQVAWDNLLRAVQRHHEGISPAGGMEHCIASLETNPHPSQVPTEAPSSHGIDLVTEGSDNNKMLPNEPLHHQGSGADCGVYEIAHEDETGSESGQEDLEDEGNADLGMRTSPGTDDAPLDMDDILLDVDDVGIPLDEDGGGDADEEVFGEESDAAIVKITEEHQGLSLDLEAGCVWDAADYSCAFDAVFMVFYSIYGRSSQDWRNIWKGESPERNAPLGNFFDLLLSVATTCNPQEYSSWFSRCRDIFRDQVTESNPTRFPRGDEPAPVGDILQLILGGPNAEPLAYQHLVCTGCGAEKPNARLSLSFLPYPFNLDLLRHGQDPHVLPLQLALARYIEKYTAEPTLPRQRCRACQAPQQVRSLRLSDASWTWFEVKADEPLVFPSLEIRYPLQRTYTLQAVIYLGGNHFTARIRKGPNTWWNYDGMRPLGKPQLEIINAEEELLSSNGRGVAYIIYRRDGNN